MRFLGPTKSSNPEDRLPVLAAFKMLRRVASRYPGERQGYLETAQSYKGAMRRRYNDAFDSLMTDGPLCSADYRLKSFVKAEKCEPWKLAKPRLIFPRSPRYNLVLATWLKPFEHWLWGYLKSRHVGATGDSRIVAKGLNQVERANLILRKMRQFADCVVFEVDGKAFEAHVDVWQLREEHAVYLNAYSGDRDLARVLGKQLANKGVTSSGLKFARAGGRASGDVNTGMGNSLVMLAVVVGVMGGYGCPWDLLVDGDNALLFFPASHKSRICGSFAAVASLISGHSMVLERPVCVEEEVRFGRSAPVETERGWRMVRDWRRVLSQGASSHQHLRDPHTAVGFLHSVALCECVLSSGVPILWAYAENLRRRTQRKFDGTLRGVSDYEWLGVDLSRLGSGARAPTALARSSFSRAFGVSPEEQMAIEDMLWGTPVRYRSSCPEVGSSQCELEW